MFDHPKNADATSPDKQHADIPVTDNTLPATSLDVYDRAWNAGWEKGVADAKSEWQPVSNLKRVWNVIRTVFVAGMAVVIVIALIAVFTAMSGRIEEHEQGRDRFGEMQERIQPTMTAVHERVEEAKQFQQEFAATSQVMQQKAQARGESIRAGVATLQAEHAETASTIASRGADIAATSESVRMRGTEIAATVQAMRTPAAPTPTAAP